MGDNPVVLAAAGSISILVAFACFTMTPTRRLSVAAFLAVPQFYLPNLPISVADGWMGLMAALALIDNRVRLVRPSVVLPVLFLVGAYVIAQFWSVQPFSDANVLVIARYLLFAFMACYALTVLRENKEAFRVVVKWATPAVIAQSALTLLFRFSQPAESAFLQSELGRLLVGPQARALFNGAYNNVLDPLKAGGLFVNGNVASLFGGVAFFAFVLCRQLGGSRWYLVGAAIALAGTVGTGSKTGVSLAVVLPLLYLIAPRLLSGRGKAWILPAAGISVPISVMLPGLIERMFPAFSENSAAAYASRDVIWGGAAKLFKSSPIEGLGFGGWEENIGTVTGIYTLPPHNQIIAAWANGGIIAAAIVVLFMAVVVTGLVLAALRSPTVRDARIRVAALCGLLWIFIHGMGDNTNIYGHQTMLVFAAMLVGVLAIDRDGETEPHPLIAGGDRLKEPVAPELLRLKSQAARPLANLPAVPMRRSAGPSSSAARWS